MHISEGVLSAPILAGGAVLAALGVAWGLRCLQSSRIMETSVLSAAFFVASLIHVPLGPGSVHLILNGLVGAFLGWTAFPALCTALLLQALLFSFGGLTALGANTVNMALPAVLCGVFFRRWFGRGGGICSTSAFLCGALSVAGAGLLTALSLGLSDEAFFESAKFILLAHIPVMVIEGIITAFVVSFIVKVRPESIIDGVRP